MSLVALFIVVQNTALAAPAPNTGISAIYSCRYLNILQQPAGMTVPKCINRRPHHAFQPFLNSRYYWCYDHRNRNRFFNWTSNRIEIVLFVHTVKRFVHWSIGSLIDAVALQRFNQQTTHCSAGGRW